MKQGEMFSDLALEQQYDNMTKALNMSKQTAVEWLIEELSKNDQRMLGKVLLIYEQAKQMEKEQIIDAWENGIDNCGEFNTPTIATGKQYYNETFKKD